MLLQYYTEDMIQNAEIHIPMHENHQHQVTIILAKALYSPGMGEQSGVLKDSMIKAYLGYRNIDNILKLLNKKNELIGLYFVDAPRPGV